MDTNGFAPRRNWAHRLARVLKRQSELFTIGLFAIGLLAASAAEAHVFCVGTAADLQSAFDAGSDGGIYNGEDNIVELQAATYFTTALDGGAFHFHSTTTHDLQVLGGWNEGCTTQSLDPTLSVLDGAQTTLVLSILSGGATTINYLTIQNGREPAGSFAAGLTLTSSTDTATATISYNIIRNNYTTVTLPYFSSQPAGILANAPGGLYFMNNLVAGNTSEGKDAAGEIAFDGNDCVTNNTIVDNKATNDGDDGGLLLYDTGGAGYVINNIFWGNTRAGLIVNDDFELLLNNDYGVLGGGSPGTGSANNLKVNPSFVDRPNGNYRLAGDSPLLGKGNNAPPCGLPARDLDGHRRFFHGTVDMGAYQESVFSSGFDPAT